MRKQRTKVLLRIESFEGERCAVTAGTHDGRQDYVVCVVALDGRGGAEIVDHGYRSEEEALEAWPELRGARGV